MSRVRILLLLICAALPLKAQVFFVASLDSTFEGSGSNARGTAWAILSADLSTLTYQVTYNHLQGNFTASHFHHSTGLTPIAFTGATASGQWTGLADQDVRELLTGRIYINVHSSVAPGGEIRGYLKPVEGIGFSINMDGTQAGTQSTGRGTAWAVLDSAGARLRWNATVSGLATRITAAHFHIPTGIVHATPFTDSSSAGTWSAVPDSLLRMLVRGQIYMNVHTTANPGGEIRGTVQMTGPVVFTATLDSTLEGSGSSGKGTAWGVLSADLSKLTYQVTYNHLQGTYSASHFHHSSGLTPISFSGNTSAGDWTGLADVDLRDLLKETIYVNVHSSVAPGGEIRGYLKAAAGLGFTIRLDGTQAGTQSTGKGTGWAILDSTGARIRWNVTVAGLATRITAAHFHDSGGIIHATPMTDSTTSGIWSAVPDSLALLFAKGLVYHNVHTTTNPGGEIRGTALLELGSVTSDVEIPALSPVSYRLEQNYPNPFNPSTSIRYEVPAASKVTLKVFNILGQEVATLVDQVKSAGVYSATFNAGNRASGIYFYTLTVNGTLAQTRKMVLLK